MAPHKNTKPSIAPSLTSTLTRKPNNSPMQSRSMTPTADKQPNLPQYLCAVCDKQVKDSDRAIECDCTRWWHARCALISDKQYSALQTGDKNLTMNWVCKECLAIRHRPKSNQPKMTPQITQTDGYSEPVTSSDRENQLEKVIELLSEDIGNLKQQIQDSRDENNRLSETVAIKMEVIYKMEQTILDLVRDRHTTLNTPSQQPTMPMDTQPKTSQTQPTNLPDTETKTRPRPISPRKNTSSKPTALILSDSILRGAANILKNERGLNIDTRIMPGAQTRDFSKFVSTAESLPDKVIVNIGSNNVYSAKTPNHLMRPIWLTIYAAQKYF